MPDLKKIKVFSGAAGAVTEKLAAPQAPPRKKWWRRRRHAEKMSKCGAEGAVVSKRMKICVVVHTLN